MNGTVGILAAVVFASFMCEGVATDWSANYLHEVVGAGPAVSALSYAAYTLTMVVSRFGALTTALARFHPPVASRSGAARRGGHERDVGDGQPGGQCDRIRQFGSRRGAAGAERLQRRL